MPDTDSETAKSPAGSSSIVSELLMPQHVNNLGHVFGGVILSMVEGVEQLEVYFGQYLPQLFIAGLTPILIFGFVAFVDVGEG